jgi:hypothetical protein
LFGSLRGCWTTSSQAEVKLIYSCQAIIVQHSKIEFDVKRWNLRDCISVNVLSNFVPSHLKFFSNESSARSALDRFRAVLEIRSRSDSLLKWRKLKRPTQLLRQSSLLQEKRKKGTTYLLKNKKERSIKLKMLCSAESIDYLAWEKKKELNNKNL